ncbi:helix-turn-helix transcriptional regulator [Pseudahrensia aquimaris]|uniref:Helix-turn-helix transcriptional regulator n=1 Tax=Pseudahrensia aquimaris TaxID=744461 RepID=A0ABW3FJA3_9HYPH
MFAKQLLNLIEGDDLVSVLDRLGDYYEDVIGIQIYHFQPPDTLRHCGTARVDPELVQIMEEQHMGSSNPVVRNLGNTDVNRVLAINELDVYDEYINSDVYREFSDPAGAKASGIMLSSSAHGIYFFSIGTAKSDWYNSHDIASMEQRFRSLGRALDFQVAQQVREEAATAAFKSSGVIACLLDDGLRPIMLTPPEQDRLEQLNLKRQKGGELVPADVRNLDIWRNTAMQALAGIEGSFLYIAGVDIVRCSFKPGPTLPYGPTVICEITPPPQEFWSLESLQQIFGLTLREAQVACGLLEGKGLEKVAAELGIRTTSARVYLKRIFVKTNTSSQGQLIAFLHSRRLTD